MIDSGLFVGTLRHRRFTPVAHAFTYPPFMALLDVDRVPDLMKRSRLTRHNRRNWASFDDRDHLGDPGRPLRERLIVDAASHGLELPTVLSFCSHICGIQTGLFQLLLVKNRAQRVLVNEPWSEPAHGCAHRQSGSLRRERHDASRPRTRHPARRNAGVVHGAPSLVCQIPLQPPLDSRRLNPAASRAAR